MTEKKERKTKKEKKVPSTGLKIIPIHPLTKAQALMVAEYQNDQNLFLHGVAGTGKTYMALHLALSTVMSGLAIQDKVIIVRSAVPSRDIGFLPGNVKEKAKEYEAPYLNICTDLFERGDAYSVLKQKAMVDFITTSFVRGTTMYNSVVILDEIQNFTFHEAYSVLTRVGKGCRVIASGDFWQNDLEGKKKKDIFKLMDIVKRMNSFSFIDFHVDDIVRSGFVREFIISCINYEKVHSCNSSDMNSFPEPGSTPWTPNGVATTRPHRETILQSPR